MPNVLSCSPKFLKDENVKKRLEIFLKQQGFDVVSKPKGLSNGKLAEFSKLEKRVLVTNDTDFSNLEQLSSDKIFSVVWLRIPQDKPESLIPAFSKLLKETTSSEFEGRLFILKRDNSIFNCTLSLAFTCVSYSVVAITFPFSSPFSALPPTLPDSPLEIISSKLTSG